MGLRPAVVAGLLTRDFGFDHLNLALDALGDRILEDVEGMENAEFADAVEEEARQMINLIDAEKTAM